MQIKVTLPDGEPITTLDSDIVRLSRVVGRKFTGNHSILSPFHVIQQLSPSSPHPDSTRLLMSQGRLGDRRDKGVLSITRSPASVDMWEPSRVNDSRDVTILLKTCEH